MAITNAWTTPNSTATMDLATGDTVTETIWDNLVSNVYYIGGSAGDLSKANILVNGGFEISQRSTGNFTTDGAWTLDRWRIALGTSSTITVAPNTSTIDTQSQQSLGLTYVHSSVSNINQPIEDYHQWRGKSLAFSVRAYTTTANAVRLRVDDSAGNGTAGSYAAGSTSFATLSATKTISTSSTSITVRVLLETTCTARLDNAMLVPGDVAHQYVPLHPADEWARCQRYYTRLGGVAQKYPALGGYASTGGSDAIHSFPFATRMAVTPTLTVNGTWAVNNVTGPTGVNVSVDGFRLDLSVTAAGMYYCVMDTTDDSITAEANP